MADNAQNTQLARRIWGRHPKRPSRFIFSTAKGLGLHLSPLSDKGRAAFAPLFKRFQGAPGRVAWWSGVATVNADGAYVFVGKDVGPAMLMALKDWAMGQMAEQPALAGLVDARVVDMDVPIKDDAALKAIQPDALESLGNRALWADFLVPTPALVADQVAMAVPGLRYWVWANADAADDDVPVLFQRIDQDPNRQRITLLAEQVGVGLDDPIGSGTAWMDEAGVMQLMGADLGRAHLAALAAFVQEHVGDHPALARLKDARVLTTGADATVVDTATLPQAWEGVPDVPAPHPLDAAAAVLSGLASGEDAWFWLTPGGPSGVAHLEASPVALDPKARAFLATCRAQGARVGGAPRVFGTVRRLSSGSLVFSTSAGSGEGFVEACKALAGQHPDLGDLSQARLIQLVDGRIAAAQSVA